MRRSVLLVILGLAALGAFALPVRAATKTYYVSAAGNDRNPGTSPQKAWRTVARVNDAVLASGDRVLFRGGDTFRDSTLMPRTSGAPSAPVVFSSFGHGRATIANRDGAVWFSGKRYLDFERLVLTTDGSSTGVFAGSGGGGSDHITLGHSLVTRSAGFGVIAPNALDSDWTIAHDTFRALGDSGIIVLGSGHRILDNTISYVGVNPALDFGKHGVYAKAVDLTIAGNDFSHIPDGQAISIRFHGARVYDNRIHDTPWAIAFFDDDDGAGTSYVYENRGWNITGYGFYYDTRTSRVDFVLSKNTFSFAHAPEAVNVSRAASARVTIVGNVFAGSYGSALRAAPTTVERDNTWATGARNAPRGAGDRSG